MVLSVQWQFTDARGKMLLFRILPNYALCRRGSFKYPIKPLLQYIFNPRLLYLILKKPQTSVRIEPEVPPTEMQAQLLLTNQDLLLSKGNPYV